MKKSKVIKNENGILYKEFINTKGKSAVKIIGLENDTETLMIPDKINNFVVEEIVNKAFKNNKTLKKVVLSNTINRIGSYAFAGCKSLEEVTLSCDIKIIKKYCFYNCIALKKVAIPFELIKIEKSAFENCYSLIDLTHNLKTRVGKEKLYNKNIKDKHLPIKLSSIEKKAFANCKSLESIYIPYEVNKLEKSIFRNCENLKEVPLHNNISLINSYAFLGCKNLKKIKLPSNLKKLGIKPFEKNTTLFYYDSLSKKNIEIISKFRNKIIGNEQLKINSQMIPNNNKTFYSEIDLKKAFSKYELRNPFDTTIDRISNDDLGKKSRFSLLEDNHTYTNKIQKDTLIIMMTGDMMCRGYQIRRALQNGKYNFDFSFSDIEKIIKKSDLAICNLETSTAKSIPYCTERSYIDDMISLNAPAGFLKSIRNSGFDMVINSNNHVYDTGLLGIYETLDSINKNQLIHTGVFASENDKRFVNIIVNGFNIGIVSFCHQKYQQNKRSNFSTKGLDTLFSNFYEEQVKNDIKMVKENGAEFVIAYCHWGNEYTANTTFNQRKFAKLVANAGADYLLGSHPHCLQHYTIIKTEDNRKVPCLYSAGNFISDMAVKLPETRDTLILELKLNRDKSGNINIEHEGYYPCLIKTDDTFSGGTKTFILEDLIKNSQSTEKNELYTSLSRIKNTIGDSERFKILIDKEVKEKIKEQTKKENGVKAMEKKSNKKNKKKSLKARIIKKIKNAIKHKLYSHKRELTLAKICSICEIEIPKEYKKYKRKRIDNICTSTRTLKPNSVLFTNVRGRFNSSQLELIRKNCSFMICPVPIKDCKCIVTTGPVRKSAKIFNYIKSLKKVTTVAITGSVGKTSTKEMIEVVLSEKYKNSLVASRGNGNVIFRIAENILKLKYNTKVFLQEVGIGKTNGNMKIMAQMLEADIMIYTNIKDSHIEGYGSRENIFKEKSDLSNYGNKNGIVLINYDDEILRKQKFLSTQTRFSYSLKNKNADVYAKNIEIASKGTSFVIVDNINNEEYPIELKVIGEHHVLNAVVAYLVGRTLKMKSSTIMKGLTNYKTSGIRQNLIDLGKYKVLADCYNSSYDALSSILETFNIIKANNKGEKIAVIGDVFELGDLEKEVHIKIGKLLTKYNFKAVVFNGESVHYSYEEYKKHKNNSYYTKTRKELISTVRKLINEDDIILFKASNGMNFAEAIDSIFGTEIGEVIGISQNEYKNLKKEDFTYKIFANHATLALNESTKKELILPDTVNNLPVEKLGREAFDYSSNLKTITLNNNLVRIRSNCFKNSNLEKIIINDNLKVIGSYAFNTCKNLKEVILPEEFLSIEKRAFYKCSSLKKIKIPNSVRIIDDEAFKGTNNLTIECKKNSYAENYAKTHNLEIKYY